MKIEEKLKEVLNDLCDWIQKETKKASSQAESILPAVVEATTHLADLVLHSFR